MKKVVLCVILFVSSYLLFGQQKFKNVILSETENSLQLLTATDEKIVLELNLGNYLVYPITINGDTYYTVKLKDECLIKQKGNPELPKFTSSIIIPGTSGFKAQVIKSEYIDTILPVKPSKGILSRTINPDDVPYTFSSKYSMDTFFPDSGFSFDEPYLIRDTRGVNINIFPFTYNAMRKTLRIYTSLTIEITLSGTNEKNSIQRTASNPNKFFEPIIKRHFINYKSTDKNTKRTVEETGKMLIICHNDFMDEMQTFVNHKNNIGLTTEIVNMNDVGSTANDVNTYIQSEYNDDNSLTFVLLVGDNAQIPTSTVSGGGSDPSYSLVSGSDNYPDIIIGRFSAENGSQVETMVTRTIFYENMSTQNWFHNGIGIGSDDGTGNGDDSEYDWEHLQNIRNDLLAWHYTTVSELYEGSQGGEDATGNPTASMVSNLVNSGVSIINYTGHGSSTSWSTTGFSVTDVNALTNDDMQPFIFSVACVNGNFTGTTCFAESWLRATNGSTNRPTGAVGFYGSSINQDWSPPMEAQDEFNNLLANEDYITFGALCYNASCAMLDEYGSGSADSGTEMFLTWHIFGDPSVELIPNNNNCSVTNVNENITTNKTISDCRIEVINTTISNGANVILDAEQSTTINGPFEVKLGSTLEIK